MSRRAGFIVASGQASVPGKLLSISLAVKADRVDYAHD
jgi:hypothetical protein